MTVREIIDALHDSLVSVRVEGDKLVLDPMFPETHPLPSALVEEARASKWQIIERLRREDQADNLLLEASRRLAAIFPPGCPLDCEGWQPHEDALQDAYERGDLGALTRALAAREAFAVKVFEAYRKGPA